MASETKLAYSKPLNPHANPYLSSSRASGTTQYQNWTYSTVLGQYSTVLVTHRSTQYYYWPHHNYPMNITDIQSSVFSEPKSPYFPLQANTDGLAQDYLKYPSYEPSHDDHLDNEGDCTARVSSCGTGKTRHRMPRKTKKTRRGSPAPAPAPESAPEKQEGSVKNGFAVIPFPSDLKEMEMSGKTTVMIKNIPNHFRRRDLIKVINRHCRFENKKWTSVESSKTEYDFLYLPMDFNKFWHQKKTSNLGYAFVNFTTAIAAWRFHERFDKYNWRAATNNKICEVTLAKVQGLLALEESFRTKLFYCHTNEYLPLVLNPACDGFSSFRRGCNIGIRVPSAPRHRMIKSSSRGIS